MRWAMIVLVGRLSCLQFGALLSLSAQAQIPYVTSSDTIGDALIRRTDPGGNGPVDADLHRPIDLSEIRIGAWQPADHTIDLFDGEFDRNGPYLRLDLVLDGLVCPPGDTDPERFRPFQYGANPIFGFVEIDIDRDVQTGGELAAPEFRYLGNIVRFGGMPSRPDFADRVAADGTALDGEFLTPPFVERHGEEFHLAFLGRALVGSIEEVVGNGDEIFEEGETWVVEGHGFHRAHGFEDFSFIGEYEPDTYVQFKHLIEEDVTIVSLVFLRTGKEAGGGQAGPCDFPKGGPTRHRTVLHRSAHRGPDRSLRRRTILDAVHPPRR